MAARGLFLPDPEEGEHYREEGPSLPSKAEAEALGGDLKAGSTRLRTK